MNVLVTGATGFLGGNLLRMLCYEGHSVRYLSRNGQSAIAAIDYPQAACYSGDLSDFNSLLSACKCVDWVFNAAAIVSSLERDRAMIQQINVEGTKLLFEAARQSGVKRFIHVSTVDTIGIDTQSDCTNEESKNDFSALNNPYSDTKKAAEDFLLSNKYSDIEVVIVNPGFMIGGFDTKGTSSRIVSEIMHHKGIFAPRGGNSFVDVTDVCRGAIVAAQKGRNGERYILAGHNLTYKEFFTQVAYLCNRMAPIAVLPPFLTLKLASLAEHLALLIHKKPIVTRNDAFFSLLPHYYSSLKAEMELDYVINPLKPAIQEAINWYTLMRK